ncbi:MAG: hypothetical protein U0J27_03000, partial [Phascolarctobacterium faecium]|uniref:hypothetical protein n=1 Tax=Phascolarctobacterium faecium TaxID=33025 RepID=UPI002E796269
FIEKADWLFRFVVKKLFFDLANASLSRNARPHIRFWLLFSFQGSACRRISATCIVYYIFLMLSTTFPIFFNGFFQLSTAFNRLRRLSLSY